MDNENNSLERKISITGTNNRYQIKKLTQSRVQPKKKRVETTTWKITDDHLSFSSQIEILNNIKNHFTEKKELSEEIKLAISHIERKINSYKHQDIDKKMLDINNFIKFDETIEKLINCGLICFYCSREMYILYEHVRENNQWTLDRIDNDVGHNRDNVIISCLECNLKRRRTNKDKFLFTKQLKINKTQCESIRNDEETEN